MVYCYTESGVKYSSSYYYVTNLQGDVIALMNAQQSVVAEYIYDAWGNILSVTNGNGYELSPSSYHIANFNPLRYRGYVYDNETGFYYLQSRYYDPVVGRFVNGDAYASIGTGFLGHNMFAYCNNNPINYLDSSGYFKCNCNYDGTACDFIRLEHGLPPTNCTCHDFPDTIIPNEYGGFSDATYTLVEKNTYSKSLTTSDIENIVNVSTNNAIITPLIDCAYGVVEGTLLLCLYPNLSFLAIPGGDIINLITSISDNTSYNIPQTIYTATVAVYYNETEGYLTFLRRTATIESDYNENSISYKAIPKNKMYDFAFSNCIGVKYP